MGPAFCEGEAEPGPDVRPAGSDMIFEAEGETEMTLDPKGFETGAAPLRSPGEACCPRLDAWFRGSSQSSGMETAHFSPNELILCGCWVRGVLQLWRELRLPSVR